MLNTNSETTASIPKKKVPRHHGYEMKKAQTTEQVDLGRGVGGGSAQPQGLG